MTSRQLWEGLFTELSKSNAPSLLLHEFNYYANKAINQYVNKRCYLYDINQQTTDDLRVLKSTATLNPIKSEIYQGLGKYNKGTFEVTFPDDYLHILNCICIYKVLNSNNNCPEDDNYEDYPATRLTADSWPIVMNDYYNRPQPKRPYYYIHNVNPSNDLPTNPYNKNISGTTDLAQDYNVEPHSLDKESEKDFEKKNKSNLPRTIKFTNKFVSSVNREIGQRYGNASKIRCEIRCGNEKSNYQLKKVLIDYIKVPQTIKLTKEQLDLIEDTSQIMEFPDYGCQEILNELIALVMNRNSDPRLQTQLAVTQSIASPAQAQAPQQTYARRQQS